MGIFSWGMMGNMEIMVCMILLFYNVQKKIIFIFQEEKILEGKIEILFSYIFVDILYFYKNYFGKLIYDG